MKITFVTQNEAPFRMKWMDELAKYMDVDVYHLNEYEKALNMKYINYHTQYAKTYDASKQFLGKKIFNSKMILNSGFDILLLDGYGFFAQQLLILKLILFRKKFGITVDGGFIPKKENKFKKIYKTFLIKHATFYMSTSEDTDIFLNHYGAHKDKIFRHYFSNTHNNEILSNPLNNKEKSQLRKKLRLEDKYTLIYVGKIIKEKGYDVLLNAISTLECDYQLLIAGVSKTDVSNNEIFCNDRIKILGFLNKDELNEYYKASDVFILPSRCEVWGLVICEAMAMGLPVIATNMCLAGKAMINRKNGIIVEANNERQLSDAVKSLQSRDLYEMGSESLLIAAKYSIEISSKNDYGTFKKVKEL